MSLAIRWKKHRKKWNQCNLCELCETRKKVVHHRGKIPCDVLLIGEAPGKKEDYFGKPFWGQAGILLDKHIARSGLDEYRLGFTNLVGCIPLDVDGEKLSQPHKEHIMQCAPRLIEIIQLSKPKYIVYVGQLAEKYVPKISGFKHYRKGVKFKTVPHPARILRTTGSQNVMLVKQTVSRFTEIVDELKGN